MSHILSANFDSLGFSIQGTLYLCSMLGSIIAPAFIGRFGMKIMLCVGASAFTLVVISQILPAEYQYYIDNPNDDGPALLQNKTFISVVLIASSVISGFGAAFQWVS